MSILLPNKGIQATRQGRAPDARRSAAGVSIEKLKTAIENYFFGRVIVKVVPLPGWDSTVIVPP